MGLDPVRFGVLWCRLLSMNEHLSHSAALGESLPAPHLLDIVTRHTGATICVVDTSLNILYANEAYANWFRPSAPWPVLCRARALRNHPPAKPGAFGM